jgi:hypothetical protein
MESNELVQIGTLISAFLMVVGLVIGVLIYRRQMNAQLFLEYTKRYEDIMNAFPADARDARLKIGCDTPKESEELTLVILRYLNLSSEEFYLCKNRYLSRKIWRIWEDELLRTLRAPLLMREWPKLKHEFESYPAFSAYVKNAQAKGIGIKTANAI